MERIVVALGGNALLPPDKAGDFDGMRRRIAESARAIAEVMADDVRIVLTHGNGPQVGNLLLQGEAARSQVTPPTLDVLVAETQAQIGYLLQQSIHNALTASHRPAKVATIVTQVLVDVNDPAFREPTKPVGPTIPTETEAMIKRAKGWTLQKDSRGGWRRAVPSPRPLEIIESSAIRTLLDNGFVVIAAGGGGTPVVRDGNGLRGIEAVVDKDLASSILARGLGADRLVLATDVDQVALDFGRPTQRLLDQLTVAEARKYTAAGQFPAGSMGPKVEAAVEFVEGGGHEAIITNLSKLREAVLGRAGTRITA